MQTDKKMHAIVGLVMGVILSRFGIVGIIIGWVCIIGWEIFQGWSGTGTVEFADILAGGIPLTIAFFIIFAFTHKRKSR